MLLPSFYRSDDPARAWNVLHAGALGVLLGVLAGLFRAFSPFGAGASRSLAAHLLEIALAAIVFAALCAGAAALRNFLAERLVWHEKR